MTAPAELLVSACGFMPSQHLSWSKLSSLLSHARMFRRDVKILRERIPFQEQHACSCSADSARGAKSHHRGAKSHRHGIGQRPSKLGDRSQCHEAVTKVGTVVPVQHVAASVMDQSFLVSSLSIDFGAGQL